MFVKKTPVLKRVRLLVAILSLALCQSATISYAQEKPGQPVFTGKDQWKNKYIKRAQEVRNLRAETDRSESHSVVQLTERERQVFGEAPKPSSSLTPEEDLLNKYVKNYLTVMDPKSVSDIFGRRIAKRYVAFQITISNGSKEYQFLIQDISIDLNNVADLESVLIPEGYTPSSNDISLLRGVSEKGQIYDWRNFAVRTLRGTGTVAASLLGVTTFGSSYAPGVALYNGPFASAFRDVLPDLTVAQLNRLNDSAYQSNSLVGKQGSKVIVAFVDQALLMDHELRKRFYKDPMAIADIMDFRKAKAKIHGMLITDVLDQPPIISAIVINEEQRKHFLDKPATVEGTVIGRNLTAAEIQLENAPAGVEVEVKGVPESNMLNFILTSTEPIASGTILNFVVLRNNDVSKQSFQVPNKIPVPMLDSLAPNKLKEGDIDKEVTLKGQNFIKSLFSVTGCEKIKIKASSWISPTEIKIKVDVLADAAIGSCSVQVKNGDNFVSGPQTFTIERANNNQ